MYNLKDEIFWHINNKDSIKCAYIKFVDRLQQEEKFFILPVNYTQEEYEHFLKQIDFEYYNNELIFIDGNVWLNDDYSWIQYYYDGYDDEYKWGRFFYPTIHENCIRKNNS